MSRPQSICSLSLLRKSTGPGLVVTISKELLRSCSLGQLGRVRWAQFTITTPDQLLLCAMNRPLRSKNGLCTPTAFLRSPHRRRVRSHCPMPPSSLLLGPPRSSKSQLLAPTHASGLHAPSHKRHATYRPTGRGTQPIVQI